MKETFEAVKKSEKQIYTHFTCAVNTENI